ncbi:hypothetical protein [Bacillus thuringiensis]|uniref:hypothetical protein n=1 Tax=Bacillus thuringiensis TaxID=1428 RepID=UPI00159B9383|nr:hypothetical protein [Bacillus thuringiensis]
MEFYSHLKNTKRIFLFKGMTGIQIIFKKTELHISNFADEINRVINFVFEYKEEKEEVG